MGTTKHTIGQIRDRTHWQIATLVPQDPVTLGLCSQIDLDMEVSRASKGAPSAPEPITTLLPADQSTRVVEEATDQAERGVDLSKVFAKFGKSAE